MPYIANKELKELSVFGNNYNTKHGSKISSSGDTRVECYFFDVEKCKRCPFKEGCYKEGSKTKHIM